MVHNNQIAEKFDCRNSFPSLILTFEALQFRNKKSFYNLTLVICESYNLIVLFFSSLFQVLNNQFEHWFFQLFPVILNLDAYCPKICNTQSTAIISESSGVLFYMIFKHYILNDILTRLSVHQDQTKI